MKRVPFARGRNQVNMRKSPDRRCPWIYRTAATLLLAAAVLPLSTGAVRAQEGRPAPPRIDALVKGSPLTGDGRGLLAHATAQADVVLSAAKRASDAQDVDAMRREARTILRTVNPALVADTASGGLGLDATVRQLSEQMRATLAEDPSRDVARALPSAVDACANVLRWLDAIVDAARKLEQATDVPASAELRKRLWQLTWQVVSGADMNGDGRVTVAPDQAGLPLVRLRVGGLVMTRERVVPPVFKGASR